MCRGIKHTSAFGSVHEYDVELGSTHGVVTEALVGTIALSSWCQWPVLKGGEGC